MIMTNAQNTQATRHVEKQRSKETVDAPPLWRLIPVHDYKSPAEPTSETLRNTLRNVRTWFKETAGQSAPETATNAAPKLRMAPPGLLSWVAPPPTWEDALTAFDTALDTWCNADPQTAGIQSLVAAPYSDLANIAVAWGQARNYAIIKPPTPTQILENDPEWMKQWQQNKAERLILPHLEQCYLRHHNGLDLVRRLLDWLWQTEVPCLLVTDSWAWSYLKQVHQLDAICRQPLTLAPLDAHALDRWLVILANHDRPKEFIFRQEKDGRRVLRYALEKATETATTEEKTQEKPSEFIRYLAARSRGISGVAWAIWRHTLQIAADDESEEEMPPKIVDEQGVTIWVTAWEELSLPTLPSGLSTVEAFVLHNLLLHRQVREEILPLLMPSSAAVTMQAVKRLQRAGIVQVDGHTWQVAPLAYATVRAYLRNEGYLVDEL